MTESLKLRLADWEAMRAHVESCLPMEACGLLAGNGHSVDEVVPITNSAQSPSRFCMDPKQQLTAFRHLDETGRELLGIFHSHPAETGTDANHLRGPSPTDIEEAAYPVIHVIWTRHQGEWSAAGFRIEDGRVYEIRLHVTDGE